MTELVKKKLCEIFEIEDLASSSRKIKYVYARIIFCKHFTDNGMKEKDCGSHIGRDHSTVNYLKKIYDNEYITNPYFRSKVDEFYSNLLFDLLEKDTETHLF